MVKKSKAQTFSVRFPRELVKEIDEACETRDYDCRNSWMKQAAEDKLELEASVDEEDEETKEIPKGTLSLADNNEEHKPHHDTYGNYWYYNYNTKRWTVRLDTKNLKVD